MIRKFLEAGMMRQGVCVRRYEGTPQGGPLSPLMSNILLDELDKELEKRGHKFCRDANDCNVYYKERVTKLRETAVYGEYVRLFGRSELLTSNSSYSILY